MAPPTDSSPLADLGHPWLGLESFREETRAYFFGRDVEIAEIDLRLRSHPLLVLYGRSGLGKTSILTAGLIPRLRAKGHRPALLRLDYKGRDGLFDQLFYVLFESDEGGVRPATPGAMILASAAPVVRNQERVKAWETDMTVSLAPPLYQQKSATELVTAFPLPQDGASRLWLRLHWRKEPPNITHLILDQFEEVFTIGARQAGAENDVRDALAILLQGSIPDPIVRLIADRNDFLDYFDPDSTPVRILLALRDDYVYALNRWKSSLSSLGQNNFELRALRGSAAFDAVFRPGELRCHYRGEVTEENKAETGLPPIIDEETARRIVRFVAEKGEDVPIAEIEAVPPILSLLCRELNERRFTEPASTAETPANQITFREGETDIATIITTFYERCVAGCPEAVRIFIEEELVSPYSGARVPQDEHSILKVFADGCEIPGAADGRWAQGFGDAAKARDCLKDLVNRRLLSSLGGGENPSYELIHDLLAAVAVKSRAAREERFEKEQADRRAEAEKKAKDEAEARAQIERDRVAALDIALKKETDARQEADRARRRARWLAIAAIVVALMAGVFFFIAHVARDEAEKQRGLAEEATKRVTAALEKTKHARDEAEQLIDFMVKDLHDKLESRDDMFLLEKIERRIEAHYESLTGEDQGPEMLRHWESVKLNNQGHQFKKNGSLPKALECFQKSLAIRKDLAGHDLTNARWRRDLAESYNEIGTVFYNQGNLPNTLTYYQNSLDIARQLAKQDPNPDSQRLLMDCLNEISDLQREQLDLKNALPNSQEALTIAEKLVRQEPDNTDWQDDLANNFQNVGRVLLDDENPDEALEKFRERFNICKKLTEQDPQNTVWRNHLASVYVDIGDALLAKQDMTGSTQNYGAALVEQEKIAKQNPDNAKAQEQLALIIGRVGNALIGQKAEKNYRNSIAIFEKLIQRDPENAAWQYDLAANYVNLSRPLSFRGRFSEASKFSDNGVAIMEKLTKGDPTNASWQIQLADSYVSSGDILLNIEGRSKEARTKLEKGHEILLKLKDQRGLMANEQGWLDLADRDLAKMVKAR